jgi:hypothetical protein
VGKMSKEELRQEVGDEEYLDMLEARIDEKQGMDR